MKRLMPIVIALIGLTGMVLFFSDTADSAPPKDVKDPRTNEFSYSAGFDLGRRVQATLRADELEPDIGNLVKGFTDGLMGSQPTIPIQRIDALLAEIHDVVQARRVERLLAADPRFREVHEENARLSKAFLAQHAAQPDVQVLPSGVQYIVKKRGDGASPQSDSLVVATFTGTLVDGTVFVQEDEKTFSMDSVLPEATRALQMMKVGSRWEIVFPPEAAYGAAGNPPLVGPNEALIFDVELVAVESSANQAEDDS